MSKSQACHSARYGYRQYLVAVFVGLLLNVTAVIQAGPSERPNFVWLMSEDNGPKHSRLYDPHGAPMPNIERLAEGGIIFNNAYANAPVCSVARTTLITSSYAPRIGAQHHRADEKPSLPNNLHMFPAYLRGAGYYTANNHKKDYNVQVGPNRPWDDSSKQATWRSRKSGQPFFYVRSLGTTHEGELHFSDTKEATLTDPSLVSLPPFYPDTPLFRYTLARYHDRHIEIDRQFSQTIRALEADGLLDSTFIFYFGDHGGALPRSKGYLYERGVQVPLVVHVPEKFRHLVDWPLLDNAPLRVDGIVSFVDFGPTLLHLAGVVSPQNIDGSPFMGRGITFDQVQARDTVFCYADRFDEKIDLFRSLRIGQYKYIRRYVPHSVDAVYNQYRYKQLAYNQWLDLHSSSQLDDTQDRFFSDKSPELLFDLEADPEEVVNLSEQPQHRELLETMRSRLHEQVLAMPDLGFVAETYLIRDATFIKDPYRYGQQQRERVKSLVQLADLQLVTYEEAKAGIEAALRRQGDPMEHVWALTSAASFGPLAADLSETVLEHVDEHSEPLVQAKAAEYFALIGDESRIVPYLNQALARCRSTTEVIAVLNSAAVLKMLIDGFRPALEVPDPYLDQYWVRVRLQYLLN